MWRFVIPIVIFWPILIFLPFFALVEVAEFFGCEVSAAGPYPCRLAGLDIGGFLDNWMLFGILMMVGVIFWVIPAIIIWFCSN